MRVAALAVLFLWAPLASAADVVQPSTTNNNDSCDIALTPAATLLLPYFEVDTTAPPGTGTTTIFSVVNTSPYPQIAHVTIWTDWAFPVLGFNIFLTGYDAQLINVFDAVVRGLIAPNGSGGTGTSITTPPGSPYRFTRTFGTQATPLSNTANPNFTMSGALNVLTTCEQRNGFLPIELAIAVKNALTTGSGNTLTGASCAASQIGFNHGKKAVGYITIDVVSYCTNKFPSDSDGSYFTGPDAPILFDNVLTGDYEEVGPAFTGGGPLVHIHAVPEGGLSGAGGAVPIATNLPFTFYDRYTPAYARTADRRQPLPSVWSARWIEGGLGGFTTDLEIWREGITGGAPNCQSAGGVAANKAIMIRDIVRFDEHENSYGLICYASCVGEYVPPIPALPATSRTALSSCCTFPPNVGTDVIGWFYLNLNSEARDVASYAAGPCHAVLSAQRSGFGTCNDAPPGRSGSRTASQSWVITSLSGMVGANHLSADINGVAFGNGCTPPPTYGSSIAPASQRNGPVCPENTLSINCAPGTFPAPINP